MGQARRFDQYEVMLDQDGSPIELGRGAMGVTYKALDVDLRCPVTVKVISKRCLGEESARLRFLREARAVDDGRHVLADAGDIHRLADVVPVAAAPLTCA